MAPLSSHCLIVSHISQLQVTLTSASKLLRVTFYKNYVFWCIFRSLILFLRSGVKYWFLVALFQKSRHLKVIFNNECNSNPSHCSTLCVDFQQLSLLSYTSFCPVCSHKSMNQYIKQISIVPISPREPGSVTGQPNQSSTAKLMNQLYNINRSSGTLVSMGKGQVKEMCLEMFPKGCNWSAEQMGGCSKEKGCKNEMLLHLRWIWP